MFVEKYMHSVNSSDLRDDEFHTATLPLRASAYADKTGNDAVFGSLLARVKYGSAASKAFESGASDIVALLRAWTEAVIEKGRARGWVTIRAEWDIVAAHKLYEQVARESLAYWINPNCDECKGAKVTPDRRNCLCCKGTGRADISGKKFVAERVADMVSELEGIYQAHGGRANSLLRRAA